MSRYLINLLSITGDAYCKTLRLKAFIDTLKKHLSSILDYAEVKFFHPPMLSATHEIAYISMWDLMVFGWSIAMTAY